MASYLNAEDLHIEADGTFEVFIGGESSQRNWLDNPADSTKVLVRQVYSDWDATTDPGEVHLDRVGGTGELKPEPDAATLAKRSTPR